MNLLDDWGEQMNQVCFDRALTPDEIKTLADQAAPGEPSPTFAVGTE